MKRLAAIILSLCLCIAKNDAQTNRIMVPIQLSIHQIDIASEDSIEELRMIKRISEKYLQLEEDLRGKPNFN